MVLKPSDVRVIKQSEIERADAFEKKIDEYLKDYLGEPSEPITIPIGCITPRVYSEVYRRYYDAGWTVAKKDNQEGSAIILQERRQSSYGCGDKD